MPVLLEEVEVCQELVLLLQLQLLRQQVQRERQLLFKLFFLYLHENTKY
jgi:hypothetical protein